MGEISEIMGAIALALVPVVFWGHIFFQKQKESRKDLTITFLAGAIAVFPILIYKFLWQYFPWINAFNFANKFENDLIGISNFTVIPLSVIITFMMVGIIEETMKLFAVKLTDKKKLNSIDDCMEFFIISALGFSFTENILYFYNIWANVGPEGVFVPFVMRSTFSTFAHLFFSGILGYYYGTAHFSAPVLQEEFKQKRSYLTRKLHALVAWNREKLFHEERIIEGLLIAAGLHAIFNIFLEMNWTFMILPFLISGYLTLNYLFSKKENHKSYGKIISSQEKKLPAA